uniref:Uncharacterized protein n=1 Tax=Anguilla anguilla TaxID=7936 RepID=A0A0E9R2J2_ANGAN
MVILNVKVIKKKSKKCRRVVALLLQLSVKDTKKLEKAKGKHYIESRSYHTQG